MDLLVAKEKFYAHVRSLSLEWTRKGFFLIVKYHSETFLIGWVFKAGQLKFQLLEQSYAVIVGIPCFGASRIVEVEIGLDPAGRKHLGPFPVSVLDELGKNSLDLCRGCKSVCDEVGHLVINGFDYFWGQSFHYGLADL